MPALVTVREGSRDRHERLQLEVCRAFDDLVLAERDTHGTRRIAVEESEAMSVSMANGCSPEDIRPPTTPAS